MESVNLLVTDRSPESAEQVNSLLRNSGIKIHVIHTSSGMEVKRALDHDTPILIVYANPDPEETSVEEIAVLANQYTVPMAVMVEPESPEKVLEAIESNACFVINANQDQQLIETVERLIDNNKSLSGQAKQQQYLEELEHRYNLLLDSSRDAIAYIHEGLHIYANRAYLEAIRVKDNSEITGLSVLEMMDTGETNFKTILKALSKGKFPEEVLSVTVKRPDESEFEAGLAFSPARYDGEDCIQMMVQEQNEAAELAAELERLRVMDPLTRLSNRKAFNEGLEQFVTEKRSTETAAAVLYLEPDGIRELNETLDVTSSEAFVTDLAEVIRQETGADDLAARVSDHGFAILLQRPDKDQLEESARTILSQYSNHIVETDDRSLTASCSIGMAKLGRLSSSAPEVLSRAREAHAEAASQGNFLVNYRPQLTAVRDSDDDRQWLDRIKYALANNDFYTVQQSIVDLDGEGEHLMENITFMRDESGDHEPSEFLHIAERNDLAGAIDRHVIPSLLKTFVESEERQIITLSNNSILDYGFPGWFGDQMKEYCVEGEQVILQVAAQSAHTNLKPAQRLIKELKSLGCHFSISSFDAERRSRQLLEHLDTDYLKLHQSLTNGLTSNAENQELIRKIVDAAEPHEVIVIADEVADTTSLAILWQCGVKLISGAFLKETSQVVGQ
jgi:diguanylate cyclase (GGDEF)-like protein